MHPVQQRIEALGILNSILNIEDSELNTIIQRAIATNPWFTEESIRKSLRSISNNFLNEDALKAWISSYSIPPRGHHDVGIVMAGNIPLVGFHDWLCVFVAGYDCQIKLSSKDATLLPYFISKMYEMAGHLNLPKTRFVDRLKGFDAVIATGSDNTAMHFKHYFGRYPHIIRHNRSSVAFLTGKETEEELIGLGHDIFDYFGLGCRNVSHIFAPEQYDFPKLIQLLDRHFHSVNEHHKYRNNYDYNLALYLLNKVPHLQGASIIFKEDDHISSRIASVNYSTYNSTSNWPTLLAPWKDKIQVVIASAPIPEISDWVGGQARFGQAQSPSLWDYPDGVDTMSSLCNWYEMAKSRPSNAHQSSNND